MMSKAEFDQQLRAIYRSLVSHAEDVAPVEQRLEVVNLRYAIILKAVFDLHMGNQKDQKSAIEFFQSDDYPAHIEQTFCSKAIMDKIVYEPESYNVADYNQPDQESHDLFI